jgi:hypothetical protein
MATTTWKITAKRTVDKIPKGYEVQVVHGGGGSGKPSPTAVKKVYENELGISLGSLSISLGSFDMVKN